MKHWPDGISADEKDLLSCAAAWDQCPTLPDCSSLKLAKVARERGLDFATAVLYDRILRQPENAAFFPACAESRQPSG